MLRKIFLYYILFGAIFAGLLIYFIKQETKVPYALEVDATKDTTDMAGTYYRIRVNNVGINSLSNISVYLGKNDVQNLCTLAPGQSFFFYPKPETNLEKIIITAKEGINITTDYRTPLKGIGLPGSGR
uniref:Uncharacterized conserved protein n=1 Tax=uncultured crenarchaeote 57a5 TaxID=684058 RepID=D4N727_9CREN|nr:uncharacterized conserved protein [uncultured crenarchaeote 57a5]